MKGLDSDPDLPRKSNRGNRDKNRRGSKAIVAAILLAILCAIIGAVAHGPAAAGGFVASGMLWLISFLMMIYRRLQMPKHMNTGGKTSAIPKANRFSIGALASRNAARNPLRSTLTIGLMASAAFLILSISAFQLRPDPTGVGGFELIATSSQPIFDNLNDPAIRRETFGPDQTFL